MAYSPASRKTFPTTNMGTRQLAFFQVYMGTDVETDYDQSNSLYHKAVMALQTKLELYGVGAPNGNWFTVIASASTAPFADGEENGDRGSNSILTAIVEDATGLTGVTVFNSRLVGDDIENNC